MTQLCQDHYKGLQGLERHDVSKQESTCAVTTWCPVAFAHLMSGFLQTEVDSCRANHANGSEGPAAEGGGGALLSQCKCPAEILCCKVGGMLAQPTYGTDYQGQKLDSVCQILPLRRQPVSWETLQASFSSFIFGRLLMYSSLPISPLQANRPGLS